MTSLSDLLSGAIVGQGRPQNLRLNQVSQDLNLTPQEQFLYQHHLDNLVGPGGVTNADGSRSTVLQMSTERDGQTYNLPTVWNGQELDPQVAKDLVGQTGWNRFPAYPDENTAEARYQAMHRYMDADVANTYRRK
jgi:hypothetical protein